MTLLRLALRDIGRSTFRSCVVALCAFLAAALGFGTLLVARGAQASLGRVADRLGADVIVVPSGAEARVESALLMGSPAGIRLPASEVETIRSLPGVAGASPQLYLASLANASCCTVSDMFLVAFDPATDFTVQPWIDRELGAGGLRVGEAIGGSLVSVPEGERGITLYGYPLELRAKLAPTGTNLDRSLFITAATAREMASRSVTGAVAPLVIPADSVSAILVKVAPGSEARGVAALIGARLPDVAASLGPSMFATFRRQMDAVMGGLLTTLAVTFGLSLVFIASVSAMAAHERRREVGVLRALGATRSAVVTAQVIQAAVLTIAAGSAGFAAAALGIWLFRDLIVERLGFPFLYPGVAELLVVAVAGLTALAAGVSLAVAVPVGFASLQEPSIAMRE